tara:strand:+ start:203 stop:4933 length:4731 start_codon:yes stop_codon:yes gene_type:complete
MATDISILDNLSISPITSIKSNNTKDLDLLSTTSEEDKKLIPEDNKELSFLEKTEKTLKKPIASGYRYSVPGMITEEIIDLGKVISQSWNEGKLKEVKDLYKSVKEDGIKETNQDTVDPTEEPPQLKKPIKLNELDSLAQTVKYDISTADRLSYAWDKAHFFGGHLWDLGKATFKSTFDKDKDLEDFALEETERELNAFNKKHWKFADGKKDDDTLVKGIELISHFVDPYWYAAYAYKPFRKILGTYKGFMGHSGAVVGAYNWVDQMGTKGSVDKLELGGNIGAGIIFGGITKGAFDTIAKIFPKASKKNLERVITLINKKTEKFYGVSANELNKLRTIASSKEVQAFNNEIGANLKSLSKLDVKSQLFIHKNKKILNAQEKIKQLINQQKKVEGQVGTVGVKKIINKHKLKNYIDKLAHIEKNLIKNESTYSKLREQLIKDGRREYDKYQASIVKRNVLLLEKLAANESWLTSNIISPVLSYGTMPLLLGLGGGALGIAFEGLGNDGQNLKAWMISGAMIGATLRGLRANPKFSFGTKDKIFKIAASDNLKLAIQNARVTFAATNASKLEAYGGATANFGKIMLENIDSPSAGKAVVNVAEKWRMKNIKEIYKILANSSEQEKLLAMSIVQGNDDKLLLKNKKVVDLATKIEGWLSNFQKDLNAAGIFTELEGIAWKDVAKKGLTSKERRKFFQPENYFPREYSKKIITDPKGFKKTIFNIFKSLGATDSKAKILTNAYANPKGNTIDKLLNTKGINQWLETGKKKFNESFITTPLSKHITHERKLNGPYNLVEKVLMEKGYLNTDILSILTNMTTNTAKSYAFTKQFGPNGKFLEPLFAQIKKKYQSSSIAGRWNAASAGQRELNDVYGVINAFFDSYHQKVNKANTYFTGLLSTGANVHMLDTVTIASLGDYMGSFVNSANAMAWLRNFPYLGRTTIGAASEWGPARNIGYHLTDDIAESLAKGMAYNVKTADDKIVTQMSKNENAKSFFRISTWLGKPDSAYKWVNKKIFQTMGLQWLTGNARRFSYNTGAMDTWMQSRKLYKLMVTDGLSANHPKVVKTFNWIDRLGLGMKDALKVGSFKNYDKALENKTANYLLNEAGWLFANRDALIPQMSNRLLFTMSQNPYLRLIGQFQSWAMAKSSQTHKILQRIENGDTRTFVKLMASIPVYSAFHRLRDTVKHGSSMQDPKYDMRDDLAHGLELSGYAGWLSNNIISKFIGPGKGEFLPPGYVWGKNAIATFGDYIASREIFGGISKQREAVWDRFIREISILPNWHRRIKAWWTQKDIIDSPIIKRNKKLKKSQGGSVRKKYNIGDEVNKKNIAAAAIAATMAVNGANATETKNNINLDNKNSEGVYQKYPSNATGVIKEEAEKIDAIDAQMAEASEKQILPKKKPPVTNEIKYRNISELEPTKKAWLLDTSEKVYITNKDKILPNDVIIAMASGETGWGTSGFLNKGSNNLFNFQSFNNEEKSIAASGSNAKIKVFEKPEDSITELLTWIQTKKSYAPVRQEIALYNDGKGSKERIIKAIANTGFAEDDKWANKITTILNTRIDGKHKEELNNLYNSLFVDN